MTGVASVSQKFRTLILLFPFLGISACTPRVVRISLKHIAVFIRQSYQRALEIVVGIQQGVFAAILSTMLLNIVPTEILLFAQKTSSIIQIYEQILIDLYLRSLFFYSIFNNSHRI